MKSNHDNKVNSNNKDEDGFETNKIAKKQILGTIKMQHLHKNINEPTQSRVKVCSGCGIVTAVFIIHNPKKEGKGSRQ